jgi:hypothetical protein
VYLARSGTMTTKAGLVPLEERGAILADAMRNASTKGTLAIEWEGSYGSYVGEVKPALALALAQVPVQDRPRLSALFSGGRPLSDGDFAKFAKSLDPAPGQPQPAGSVRGSIGEQTAHGVSRTVVNWGNDKVFGLYAQRLQAYIDAAKELGIAPNVTVDDHVSVLSKPPQLALFARANNLRSEAEAVKVITGRIGQLADQTRAAGGEFTLSLVGDFAAARAMGVNALQIAKKIDRLEFQVYRADAAGVRATLAKVLAELRSNPQAFANVKEFRVALTTQANGKNLDSKALVQKQQVVNEFSAQIAALRKQAGVPQGNWQVTTSLWEYNRFYKPVTAPKPQGSVGQ